MSEALMKGTPLQHNLVQGFYPIKQASARPNAHSQLLRWIMYTTMSSCKKPSGMPTRLFVRQYACPVSIRQYPVNALH